MTKSRIFLMLSLSFIIGIFIRSFWEADFLFWYYAIGLGAVIFLFVFYKNKLVIVWCFTLLFILFGIWRTDSALQKIKNVNLDGQEFSGKMIIAKEPESKDNYLKIIGEIKDANNQETKVLVNVGLYSDLKYSDELKLNCLLKTVENRDQEFDYRMYLAKDGIFYECQKTKFEKTGNNFGNRFYAALLSIKNKLAGNIDRIIPQPEGALANGLIFGGSASLPKKVSDNFSRTGMTHIVAVSGYNVTIIAEYLIWLAIMIGLWRKQSFWFAIVGIILFVLMVGAPSSAVRAGVMGGVLLWAMKNGRLANSTNAVLLAGGVMLLLNPLLLRYDIGFQLSFSATLGIVYFAPFFEKFISKKYNFLDWQGIIFLSIAAQIFVMPIIMNNFHRASLVSLLANLLILPIIPLSMLMVFMTAVVGLVSYPLSMPLAWVTYLPLKYEVGVINLLGGWHWSSAEITNFDWKWVIGWYLVLFFVMLVLKRKKYA